MTICVNGFEYIFFNGQFVNQSSKILLVLERDDTFRKMVVSRGATLSLQIMGVLCFIVTVHGQGQGGFISIDCGSLEDDYEDDLTGIHYTNDTKYVEAGMRKNVDPNFNNTSLPRQFQTVRSFPVGKRNCYNIFPVSKNSLYLIRAWFMYGNYDHINTNPQFYLYLGINPWATIKVNDPRQKLSVEILSTARTESIAVCLVNIGFGTPFISALELRPLETSMYSSYSFDSGSTYLTTFYRWDLGAPNETATIRYEKDLYDRCWQTLHLKDQFPIYSSNSVSPNNFQPPSSVMQTAVRPSDLNASIYFRWTAEQLYNGAFYFAFHFSELEVLNKTELREFNIFIDDGYWSKDDPWNAKPVNPGYLTTISIYTTRIHTVRNGLSVSINKTRRSTHPPILNAFELYSVFSLSLLATYQQDVDALMDIKREYALKGWLGDPCLPKGYSWDVLSCSNAPFPRIISLNLKGYELMGEILRALGNLQEIQILNLANNSLNGAIPEFLADLPNLVSLDLRDNNLSGPVPRALLDKNNSGSLFLSIEGNPRLCLSNSCVQSGDSKLSVHKRHQKVSLVVIIASSLGGVLVIVSLLVMVLLLKRRKLREAATVGKGKLRSSSTMSGSQAFTYSEIVSITNNFQNAIGRGGYGTVFHGCLKDGRQVAVKIRSDNSRQGLKEFMAEIELLMRVHHKYLTTFLGFCEDGNNMILIYEYMSNGNLQETLSNGNSSRIMNWEQRLKIALGAAQGLEYLHCGCKPPIIHRDVKTSNILLSERMEAKLADFGLSKAWPNEVDTHISTAVVGTPGYVDPEYYITNKLNEKSDVYSFGIVLLEILSGQPSIIIDGQTQERIHIVQWITPNLEKGDIQSVVDPRMQGGYDMNSVWKVAEIAMACTPQIGIKRPTMSEVVNELKGSRDLEFARLGKTNSRRQSRSQPMNSSDAIEFEDDSLFYPSPR
ncbi:hypothetical protein AMTRI_Chr05g58570 [Amborella trichopoda]